MERKTYTRGDVNKFASQLNLGAVHFQFNIAENTGRVFEVGFIWMKDQQLSLFAKSPRSYSSFEKADNRDASEDTFYICNEYESMVNNLTKE